MILLMSLFCNIVALSGILGNVVGYWFGSSGYYLYNKQDSFGSKKIFGSVKDFFEKYGGKTIFSLVLNISNFCAYSCWNRFYG
jgi:membrane protein YqaA with SNARE-associated domain